MHKHRWHQVYNRLIACVALMIGSATVAVMNGNGRSGSIDRRLIALVGVVVFIFFAVVFLHILTNIVHRLLAHKILDTGRAATIQFVLRTFGYVAILLTTLELLAVPIGHLLLGGAALGIILGVAAQQALANFFASIVLIIVHPFAVGDHVTFNSGSLGGRHEGIVVDINLTHTRLQEKGGRIILLPNATLLSGTAIMTGESAEPEQPKS